MVQHWNKNMGFEAWWNNSCVVDSLIPSSLVLNFSS